MSYRTMMGDLIMGRTTGDYISHVCEKYTLRRAKHRERNRVTFYILDIKGHPNPTSCCSTGTQAVVI